MLCALCVGKQCVVVDSENHELLCVGNGRLMCVPALLMHLPHAGVHRVHGIPMKMQEKLLNPTFLLWILLMFKSSMAMMSAKENSITLELPDTAAWDLRDKRQMV